MPVAQVENIENVGGDFYSLRVKLPEGYTFKVGQALAIDVPADPDNKENKAGKGYYSFASPARDKVVELLVEKRDGYVSKWVTDRKPGDKLEITDAMGNFSLQTAAGQAIVMLGSGAGLAPLRGMLLTLVEAGLNQEVSLFQGKAGDAGYLFDEEFKKIEAQYDRFHYYPVEGNPAEEALKKLGGLSGADFYLAGFNRDVDPMIELLQKAEIDIQHIKTSKFG